MREMWLPEGQRLGLGFGLGLGLGICAAWLHAAWWLSTRYRGDIGEI